MTWQKWLIGIWLLLHIGAQVSSVGRRRRIITANNAAWSVVIHAFLIYALVTA